MKKYTAWLKAAIAIQLLTAVVHGIGLFSDRPPNNETERRLDELMNTYTMDLGAGFNPSMSDLFFALSSCYSLLCLMGGLVNLVLIRRNAELSVTKGIVNVEVVIFGVAFVIMAIFTFLPPILMTGLAFLFLVISRMVMPRQSA